MGGDGNYSRRGDFREEMGKGGGDGKMEGGDEMGREEEGMEGDKEMEREGRRMDGRRKVDGKGGRKDGRIRGDGKGWKEEEIVGDGRRRRDG